jgi:uncharacterized RDD family membrane protein YckC
LAAISFIGGLREAHHRFGPFLFTSFPLFAASAVILYTIPSKSARILARRAISFVVDLAILALFTYAVLDLLYRVEALTPNAVLSMAIVWTWFFYFVLFDWRFEGTPGMLIVGLRLKNAGNGISGFVKCLLRILVTLSFRLR